VLLLWCRIKPQGSLRGEARHLALMVVLDSTRNTPALREAYQVNIPTIALVNPTRDLSNITYPVLARDFHPGFVHFFLDWLIKVVNVQPGEADALTAQAQS
jgi:ribosomal protein S2